MLVLKPAFNSMLVKSDHVRSGVLRRARDAKKNYPYYCRLSRALRHAGRSRPPARARIPRSSRPDR